MDPRVDNLTHVVCGVSTGEAVEPLPEQGVSEIPAVRKPSKETAWLGHKESAVRQHRQEMKTKMKTNNGEEVKLARTKQVSHQAVSVPQEEKLGIRLLRSCS